MNKKAGNDMSPAQHINSGRRDFLRAGLFGTMALSTVSLTAMLTGCASAPPAAGMRVLRESDLVVLRALMPVVLDGAFPVDESREKVLTESLQLLDALLEGSSGAGQQQVRQLFDLMTFAPTRRLVAGLAQDWAHASPTEINDFLNAWRNSRIGLLRAGYLALTQMLTMNWYMQPRSWAAIHYVPPQVVG